MNDRNEVAAAGPAAAGPAATAPGAGADDDTLRILTCGSVDDGKSTLMGRLLFDAGRVHDDQLAALRDDSRRFGTQGDDVDFSLLFDGLAAEREQRITIDVAWRYFTLGTRRFIVADAPGHEQYTRNMITAASTSDLAIILVDARKGLLTQTKRHTYLAALLGIHELVLAVNKMDLVDWSQDVFDAIVVSYREFAQRVGIERITAIPTCATAGDNLVDRGTRTGWYDGPTLVDVLKDTRAADVHSARPFRMPVQRVNRHGPDFRGFSGRIAAGEIVRGARVTIAPRMQETAIARIVAGDGDVDGDVERAIAGQSVTLVLTDQIDVSRGDLIGAADAPPRVGEVFEAAVVWMANEPLLPARQYLLRVGTALVGASLSRPHHRIDVNTLETSDAETLALNEIGVCEIYVHSPVAFDPYVEGRDTGGFILIDRLSNETIGAGMITRAIRDRRDVPWQALDVDKNARARLNGHRACIVWLTGLSGSGKSTIANVVEKKLHARDFRTYILDGDNVRHGLCNDLGFSEGDRVENIRRVAEVARLMVDAGTIVIVSFISPFRAERRLARNLVAADEFVEVLVDTPLDVAEARDPKGLYKRARRGEIANFTGIDSPYERPEAPELTIDTVTTTPDAAADRIIERLRAMRVLERP